jgi:tripeptidyl-peptidase-2
LREFGVRVQQVVSADSEGNIVAPDGATYQLNADWVNPSGQWHVGVKRAFDLFTTTLITRLRKERRKAWDTQHRECVTSALAAEGQFEQSLGSPPRALTDAEIRFQADLAARLKLLEVTPSPQGPHPASPLCIRTRAGVTCG